MAGATESKHNQNLDILRGFAALTVVCFHLISCFPKAFDQKYELGTLLHYNFPGHMSVLVFFILSGYVIAINTPRLISRELITDYIRKRLVRIVPIYLLAMLFTVAITWGNYDWKTVICNFFFISVPANNVMIENGPAWSLNYELFYYFVFILFSRYNIDLKKTVGVLVIVIAGYFAVFHNVKVFPLFISYVIGFLFWATGAMIAQVKAWPRWSISSSRILALFILMYCMQPFNPYGPVLKVLHLPVIDYTSNGTFSEYSWYQQSISYTDLYYYPLTIMLILALTHCYTKNYRYLLGFIYVSAVFRMVMIYKVYDMAFIIREHYVVPGVILISSIVLWFANFDFGGKLKKMMKSTSSLGGISYGVYMIHMPLIYFFGRVAAISGWFFAAKLVVYYATLLLAAYLLEEKFQSFVKKMLRRKSTHAIATANVNKHKT